MGGKSGSEGGMRTTYVIFTAEKRREQKEFVLKHKKSENSVLCFVSVMTVR